MSRLNAERILTAAACGAAATEVFSEPVGAGEWALSPFVLWVSATTEGVIADPPEDPPIMDVNVQILAEPSVDGVNFGVPVELVADTSAVLTGGVLVGCFPPQDELLGAPVVRFKCVALADNPTDVLLDVWITTLGNSLPDIAVVPVFTDEPVVGEVDVISEPVSTVVFDADKLVGFFLTAAGDAVNVDVSPALSPDGQAWTPYLTPIALNAAGTEVHLGELLATQMPIYVRFKLGGQSGNGDDTTVSLALSYGRSE